MGLITKTARTLLPALKESASVMIPTWQSQTPQSPGFNYETLAKDGYSKNDLVFACVEEIATSAAEPRLVGVVRDGEEEEIVRDHDLVRLLDRPNPWLSQFDFWATIQMHLCLAGNAFIVKERSAAGKVVELWPLRPDWVKVVPDRKTFISHYEFRPAGGAPQIIEPQDMIHVKNRHPLDQFYGMPPLLPVAGWVDIDSWMRNFVKSFFQNAGVPSGIITTSRNLSQEEKGLLRQQWRSEFSGPGGWNKVAVFDGAKDTATFTPMGLPLGGRGLVVPQLEDIAASRIALAFRVPAAILGIRLAMEHRGLTKGAVQDELYMFWVQTLIPIYKRLSDAMTMWLLPDFKGLDALTFDYSKVKALQEDTDAINARWRANMTAAGCSVQEFRRGVCMKEEIDPSDTFLL